ncbi:hypothetical protein F2Q68_00005411 [Brassica cretica]|uniref:Uncharacterized protein n=1 Tax=Brassica cretica TaxID=69181 RepID=A0A8S9JB54_BRACR|nr:hypothetical protein F2Q68_00005411 [Brassica cretica]
MGTTYDTRSRPNEGSTGRCRGVRHPLQTNTSSTTLESWSDQDGARSVTRAQFEDVKLAFRAMSRSGVRHPLQAQLLVDNSLEAERPGGETS